MTMRTRDFPNRFAIMPNARALFDHKPEDSNLLEIVQTVQFRDVARIYLLKAGALAFEFLNTGALRSIEQILPPSSGKVADHVIKNHDQVMELQRQRVQFANFIAGCLFGNLSAQRGRSLEGAQNATMDNIIGFEIQNGQILIEKSPQSQAALNGRLIMLQNAPKTLDSISGARLQEAIAFLNRLDRRSTTFEYADVQLCVTLNYQAAILHHEQHVPASLALNFAVAEALIHEIFLCYGQVGASEARDYAKRPHTCPGLSKKVFDRLTFKDRLTYLQEGNLFGAQLSQRIEETRKSRNNMLHNSAAVTARDAGNAQSIVRDLWAFLLNDPFDLSTVIAVRL